MAQHKGDELTLEGINQFYLLMPQKEMKLETLLDFLERTDLPKTIVFCNTPHQVDLLTEQLENNFTAVSAMHSEMEQAQRETIMTEFRSSSSPVLVTTDLRTGGNYFELATQVVNYDLPDRENYIHRVGRRSRLVTKGAVVNILSYDDLPGLEQIEAFYSISVMPVPANLEAMFDR